MARADKSKFLSKLARFVANPTTDWAALDAAQAGQKGDASGGEGLELTQAEILAISHQRRKDNRNIRIQEFAMLRQVRAGASAPNAHSMVSSHSKQPVGSEPVEAAKVAAIQKPTLIADFSVNKINRIEQQMAAQWWDSVDKTRPLHTQIPIQKEILKQKEIPKTQMLIETRIAQFDMPNEVENSDVIAFDPAMLEDLPVQPVTPVAARAAVAPSVAQPVEPPPAPVQPISTTQRYPTPAAAVPRPQVLAHSPAPISAQVAAQPPAQMAVQSAVPSAVPSTQTVVPLALALQPGQQQTGAELHAVQQTAQAAAAQPQAAPAQAHVPASHVLPAAASPSLEGAIPVHAAQASAPAEQALSPALPAAYVPKAPVTSAGPVPSGAEAAAKLAVDSASPTPAASAQPKQVGSLSPTALASVPAAPVQQGGYMPASFIHGSGEHVDFSADQPLARAASTFVYRDAFTEFPQEEPHEALASGGLAVVAEGELPLHPLAEADSRSMAEAQAELYGENALQANIVIPPEYTPNDLPECLNEPAILFVQGKFEQAETQLLELARAEQMRAQMGHVEHEEPHVLLALLDFYRCTEQEEKFETASIEMVRHFDRSAPQYQGADLGAATRILSTLGAFADIDYSMQNGWRCPAELDLTDVMLLRAQLMTQPPQVLLDWQMLHTILDDAVEPLLDQFRDLAGRKIDLLMWGGEQLLACCIRKINEQNGEPSPLLSLLWLLRLELERIMHGQEAFDQVALEYCVALEESPPSWVRTRCHFIDADNALSMLDGDKPESAALADAAELSKDEEVTLKHPLQWKGTFQGNIQALLQAVSNECQGEFCVIDCSQFNGMDYPAAVALLEWLMEPQNAQRQIQFVQVNRLLAVFWRVMGITAQATVRLRRD